MKWPTLLPLLFASISCTVYKRDYDAHDYYAVELSKGIDPQAVSQQLGLLYEGPLGELRNHHIFRTSERQHDYDHIKSEKDALKMRRRKREAGSEAPHFLDDILFTQKQDLSKRFPLVKRSWMPVEERQLGTLLDDVPSVSAVAEGQLIAKTLGIQDPIFQEQWHLHNTIQIGHDINVTGVWMQGITGRNSTVCIVDDGLDMDSDDLKDNYFAQGSYDFNDQVKDPKPRLSDDRHGTRCAGEIGAVRNDVCGVGVAYDSKVAGVRILSKAISDSDEALAMNYAFQENQIYSCSWGPPDDGRAMDKPGVLIRRAMLNGVQNGRSGRGSIYVFAIGNGAANDDNCNFDGYTNSIYSVSVGGIDRKGLHPYYSEKCSAQLVVTYSSGSGDAIHTTDVGKANCYNSHGGTSAAGPLVAGIYALMLEVNPSLGWRDLQWLTVITAVRIDQESDWQLNKPMNKEFSHQFGYGKADAYALVEAAKTWINVKPQAWFFSPWLHVKTPVPQGDRGLASHFTVTEDMVKNANLERLEHVTVTMNVEHTRRGDLSVELHSPSGMISHIATHRRNDAARSGYEDWTFMSVAHWGESGVGTWTVVVKDTNVNEYHGLWMDWRIKLWGECIDAESQGLLPMPTEHDDDDHNDDHPENAHTQTATVGTTSVAVPTETGLPAGNPADHIDRPAKPQVTTEDSTNPTTTAATSTSETAPSVPVITQPPIVDEEQDSKPSSPASSSSSDNLFPHPFPTFGVSKGTQKWVYGSFVLIIIFLIGLCAFLIYMRRKKRWMNRDDYGFEMIDHDDNDDAAGANGAAAGKKGRRQRAGELYDAFAEGSDDEAEPFDLGEDSEDEQDDDDAHLRKGEKRADERYRDSEPLRQGTDVE
jgi:kexin